MNNYNIKQLAKQAGLNSDVVPYHLTDYDCYEYPNVEEFAKLIIAECEKIVGQQYGWYNGEYYDTLADAIREHFGIKDE